MGASRFIAQRLSSSKGHDDNHSRISNILAMVSVSLSIAVMIVAIAVVGGFKSSIRGKLSGFMGSTMLVQPGQGPVNEFYPFADTLSYRQRLLNVRGVESLSGVAYTSGLLKTSSDIEGLLFKGVDSLYNMSFFEDCIVSGEIPSYGGRISSDIMISSHTASKLGLEAGSSIVAYFTGDDVKVRKFTVAAIYNTGLEDIDSHFALADIRQIRRLNGWGPHEVSSVEIRSTSKVNPEILKDKVEEIEFAYASEDDTPLFVTGVREVYSSLFDWLNLLDLNVLLIMILMIAVAGFNMIAAVLIILFENISAIGLLKSLGMNNREVGKVFQYRAGVIVGKGLLAGNAFGLLLCIVQKATRVFKLDPANYFVDSVPVSLNVWHLILLNAVSAALIMLITALATRYVSKISPDRTLKVD